MIPRRKAYIPKGELGKIIWMLFRDDRKSLQCLREWEDTFARYLGVKFAVAVNSGRVGMELILKSLKLRKGDEVIIPAYTLKDLIPIIQALGLRVVPADIDVATFNLDPHSVAERITGRTRVILATHLFGSPCPINEILKIAEDNSILVIEDCAHSVGAKFRGWQTGSFGHAAFFSFETIKPINTYGGGMIVTNDRELIGKMRQITTNYKSQNRALIKKIIAAYLEDKLLPTPLAFPALYLLASAHWKKRMTDLYRSTQRSPTIPRRLTGIQAFLGLKKIKTLEERNAKRRRQAGLLSSLLPDQVKPQHLEEEALPNYYFFVALLPEKVPEIRRQLLLHGVDAGIRDEIADDCGAMLGYRDCPNATKVFQHAIQLPLHEAMSERHIRRVAQALKDQLS